MLRRALCLVVVLLAAAPAAGAVTWHNRGDTAFSLASPSVRWGGAISDIICANGTGSGTAPATSFVGTVWAAATLTVDFNCTIAAQSDQFSCKHTFTAAGQSGSAISGTLDTTCVLSQGGVVGCTLHAAAPTTYTNPSGTVTGHFAVPLTTAAKWTGPSPTTTCPFDTPPAHYGPQDITVTSATGGPSAPHGGPSLTRTP